jgi:hypothetical protein
MNKLYLLLRSQNVDVIGHKEEAGASDGGAVTREELGRAKVRFPLGLHNALRYAFVFAVADLLQLLTVTTGRFSHSFLKKGDDFENENKSENKYFIKVNRYAELSSTTLTETLCAFNTFLLS